MKVYGPTGRTCKPFDDLPAEHIAAAAFASRFFGRRLVDGLCVAVRVGSRLDVGLAVLHAAGRIRVAARGAMSHVSPAGPLAVYAIGRSWR